MQAGSQCAAVIICVTLVNTQTHTQTARLAILLAQPADWLS